MPRVIVYLLLLLFYFTTSCTEDYRLHTTDDSRILVVNGCITNGEGPYCIRLSDNVSKLSDAGKTSITPVTEARLTITDDLGNVDELKPLWNERVENVSELWYYDYDGTPVYQSNTYLLMPDYNGGYDSIQLGGINNSYNMEDAIGAYYTTSTTGMPGRTYTLQIEYQGRTYTAVDRMPSGTVIDSVTLYPTGEGIDGKGYDDFYIPYLHFAEPQDETNYYLLTYGLSDYYWNPAREKVALPVYDFEDIMAGSMQTSWATWGLHVVSDRFMSPYMADYKVDDGATAIPWVTGTDEGWNGRWECADVYLASVSHAAYRYYHSLIEQFYQDGGAFSSAPCSPPTNVNNGGQGFFMAVSVSQKRISRNTGPF